MYYQNCGNTFSNNEMADWTICFSCMAIEQKAMGYDYTDSYGIGWTTKEIREAGGIHEIEQMIRQNNNE